MYKQLNKRCLCWSPFNIYKSVGSFHTSFIYNAGKEIEVFDRNAKKIHKDWAAKQTDVHLYDYVKKEIAFRLSDRILDIKRSFDTGLDLGCGRGMLAQHITTEMVGQLYMSDQSELMLEKAIVPDSVPHKKLQLDEEDKFPLESDKFDIVLSNLNLHWVNNLPGCLSEIKRILKDDGVFLATMFSGNTLFELRSSLLLAELEREGGFSTHVSPFTENTDIVALLNAAGFQLITVDTDDIKIGYPSLFELMWDLQGMAENNASLKRKLHLHRETLLAAAAIYQEMYGEERGIPASFEITYMIGWKPDERNPVKVADRGSAQISMQDIAKLEEMIKEHGPQGRVKFIEEILMKRDDDKNDN